MAQTPDLGQLIERRRLLVAQSSQLRNQLAQDFGDLNSSTAWVERGYAWLKSGRMLWPWLAGAAGLAIAYRKGGWLGTAQKLLSAFQIARKIGRILRTLLQLGPKK